MKRRKFISETGTGLVAVTLTSGFVTVFVRPGTWGGAAMLFMGVFVALSVMLASCCAIIIALDWLAGGPGPLAEMRSERRRMAGLCEQCGYDLFGNTSGVCPECGAARGHVNRGNARG